MKSYQLTITQSFPKSLPEIWDFFSSPNNLEAITPSDMKFDVMLAPTKMQKMYAGMIITYKVTPLLGIKLNWMTEITQVAHEQYFIDEQRFGPFKFWHHQHHFKAIEGGVEMTDILTYSLPLGFIGKVVHKFLVRKKLFEIFRFRREKTIELFGELAN
jgi:ligand-binding SRPBCC domain-containing protein